MKTLIALITLIAFSHGAYAENEWLTNMSKVMEKAKNENKLILLNFTGSDWCPRCISLNKNVFAGQNFKKYTSENLVLLEVDLPKKSGKISQEQLEYNKELAKKYRVYAYPTVIITFASGKELYREVGFNGDSKSYLTRLKEAKFQ